jgi:hypothetical protein
LLRCPLPQGDGTPHGSYYWDQSASSIVVKMKGGKNLEIRTENAVMVRCNT